MTATATRGGRPPRMRAAPSSFTALGQHSIPTSTSETSSACTTKHCTERHGDSRGGLGPDNVVLLRAPTQKPPLLPQPCLPTRNMKQRTETTHLSLSIYCPPSHSSFSLTLYPQTTLGRDKNTTISPQPPCPPRLSHLLYCCTAVHGLQT